MEIIKQLGFRGGAVSIGRPCGTIFCGKKDTLVAPRVSFFTHMKFFIQSLSISSHTCKSTSHLVCAGTKQAGKSLARKVLWRAAGRINRGVTYLKQHTIGQSVWCSGVGLHCGLKVALVLKPAPVGHGVRFVRSDIFDSPSICANYNNVVNTFQATTIGSSGVAVSTVEHLMAALYGCGVDNVLVELSGPEAPIFDGSAAPYVKLIRKASLREQDEPRNYLTIQKPLTVSSGDSFITATPSDVFQVRYEIDYPHPRVGKQAYSWALKNGSFGREIAKARTFGFLKDVRHLQKMGLIQGGSLSNAVVFDDQELLNSDGFRFEDECVRHKILDFVGDLALIGLPVIGKFEIRKAGHGLHSRFLTELMNGNDYAARTQVQIPEDCLSA
jgi:UDP-3-O-[3-hydroxymyristoyl] N-acetylglucosamine deacetylase